MTKRIVVTGIGGRLGRLVARALHRRPGVTVRAYPAPPTGIGARLGRALAGTVLPLQREAA